MTKRLFDEESHKKFFCALVLNCEKEKDLYKIVLDQTEFFPEGGGQKGDEGYISESIESEDGFFVSVLDENEKEEIKLSDDAALIVDTQEKDGVIFHYCNKPFSKGKKVFCLIDFDVRFRRMQNHTGEHIVSGIINKYFGFDNVGFHMGSDDVTLDINGTITKEDISFVEKKANEAVVSNVPVYAEVFSGDELTSLEYRSKLDISENVRIVTVEGYDKCACCAPHVSRTGEIGIIKIIGFANYKQGMRIHMLCGFDALCDYEKKLSQTKTISNLLSAKPHEITEGVLRVLEDVKKEKQQTIVLKNKIASMLLENAQLQKVPFVFTDINDPVFMRYIATDGVEKTQDVFGVFCLVSENSYRYVIAGKNRDMRAFAKEINSALCGRGGGDSELIQGSVSATEDQIKSFFN